MKLNYIAPMNTSGYGLTGLNILKALVGEGVDLSLFPLYRQDIPNQDDLRIYASAIKNAEEYDDEAPSLRVWHQFSLAEHVGKGLHCAMPIFELDAFRKVEMHHMSRQDKLFVNSQWAKDVLIENGFAANHIHVATLGVDTDIFHPLVEPMYTFSADTTVFANVGKWEIRKGHDVLRDAFNAAFTPKDNVMLLLHCRNLWGRTQEELEGFNKKWGDWYLDSPLGQAGKITVNNRRYATQQELASFMASAHCGVFPARAEGWNLELHEMLCLGKSVITTNYSAHTEFCNEQNARLIPMEKREVANDGVFFFAGRPDWFQKPGQWGAFDDVAFDALVHHLREVHRKHQEDGPAALINPRGVETGRYFSWSKCANDIVSVLN